MNWLTREQVKQIVTECLAQIADWNGDPESFLISSIPDQHKIPFMECIQTKMNGHNLHIDLSLNDPISGINHKNKIGDLISYVYENQSEL